MPSKTIIVNNTEILLKKSVRSRHMTISVKPFIGVRITIPERISFIEGEKFAKEKIFWIEEHVSKITSYEKSRTIFDASSNFRTRNHRLELKVEKVSTVSVRIKNDLILVKYPEGKDPKSSEIQKVIRRGIIKAYTEEAKEYLPKRLNDLSDKHNLQFSELFIKNIKSRWGSCSGKNNINLSIHLMRLPDHLIDYVLLHELAHTKIKNHSKKFWNYLDSLAGNAKKLDKELKLTKLRLD